MTTQQKEIHNNIYDEKYNEYVCILSKDELENIQMDKTIFRINKNILFKVNDGLIYIFFKKADVVLSTSLSTLNKKFKKQKDKLISFALSVETYLCIRDSADDLLCNSKLNEIFIHTMNGNRVITMGTLYNEYLLIFEKECKPNTIKAYTMPFKKIENKFMNINVKFMENKFMARQLYKYLTLDFSKNNVALFEYFISKLFIYAVDMCYMTFNPHSYYNLKTKKKRQQNLYTMHKAFSEDEYHNLINRVNDPKDKFENLFRIFILIACGTGARPSEIYALNYSDIDFEKECIHITKGYSNEILTTPKTPNSIRSVYISKSLLNTLKDCKEKSKVDKIFPDFKAKCGIENISYKSFDNKIKKKYKEILKEIGARDNTLYGLRHTYTTLNLKKGANIKGISAMLGHKNTNLTMTVYEKYEAESFRPLI